MHTTTLNQAEITFQNYRRARIAHWDAVARQSDSWIGWGRYYHQRLTEIFRFLVLPGQRVIEIGCGQGDLLAALKPALGLGVDFSSEMIKRAKRRHPELFFIQTDTHDLALREQFDVIILSDLVNDLWDVQAVFEQMEQLAHPRTRVIINTYSRLWEQPLAVADRLGLAKPTLYQNWLTVGDVINLLNFANLEVIRHWEEILWPLPIPFLSALANRYLVKLWPFKMLALTNFIVARLWSQPKPMAKEPSVSVIVPARNEGENIPHIVAHTPQMGAGTELVFVEGHSKDNTYAAIEQTIAAHPEMDCKLFRQTGEGKGDAVRLGFAQAKGDILMILYADLTVPPYPTVRLRRPLSPALPDRSFRRFATTWCEKSGLGGKEDRFLDFILGVRNHGRSC